MQKTAPGSGQHVEPDLLRYEGLSGGRIPLVVNLDFGQIKLQPSASSVFQLPRLVGLL